MAVPLDQQYKIEKKGIIEERISVLHLSGIDQHYFVTYIPLPTNIEDDGAIEQWIERMTFICDDLTWLLQQNHTKFWCEVAFNRDFHSMLDSYLRYAPRPQRTISINNYSSILNNKELEENISRLMFMCILRLSTHKESSENFFTPEGFGHVIYDNYIFDIPRLFDICSLYAIHNKVLLSKMIGNIFKQQQAYKGFGHVIYDNYIFDIPRLFDICSLYAIHNKVLLSKMIGNIFKQQQAYSKDLKDAIKSIKDVIAKRIRTFHTQSGPKKLNTTTETSSMGEIIDLLYYILDLSCTINRFFSVYPQGRIIFFHEDFHLTLIQLFETFLRVYERAQQFNEISDYIEIFEETKYETITLFNDLLASCCIDSLLNNDNKSENVESIINIFSLLITEKRFLAAYEDYFNLCEIIDLVHQTTGLLDDQQIEFYTDGVKQAIEVYGTPSCKRKLTSVKTSVRKKTAVSASFLGLQCEKTI
ncbi:unnamed protein product [Rotaria sordida]|uniref:Uncharacterized protein n=2 Tax=Rotaria sordida TaxID=392033 RepID=A0A815GGK1_9BILA|nr:unnamed protein product [Rotaria sordida]